MARIKKNELIEIVKQLQDINEQIGKQGKLIDDINLAECQELAVKLGTYIEGAYSLSNVHDVKADNEEKEKDESITEIVHSLEAYCELIYEMSLTENQNSNKIYILTKGIKKCLFNVKRGIQDDLPVDRKQIVFLPYKASMWDSLESIWRAACADRSVDAYVVPIPYFDRNPDGSVAQWHYEGNDYPDYVPITDWQKYSIPDEKPDVIFIHNPYDDCNYVTSVHPQYYSRELKKYTKCLVYVPYFVLDGIYIGKSFTTSPACLIADYIFCQNENEKKIYINDLTAIAPQKDFQNHIMPFGSPKLDKVKHISEDNIEIPELWKERIKKDNPLLVVFYNSSVGSLLRQDGSIYFQKMIDIFNDCFKANILIIWRPHPLMEATLSSMRQDYYQTYMKIKAAFIQNDMGILDETENVYPVMCISDAYMGDWSSIISLYAVTDKIITIIDENAQRILFSEKEEEKDKGRVIGILKKYINKEFYKLEINYPEQKENAGSKIYSFISSKNQ